MPKHTLRQRIAAAFLVLCCLAAPVALAPGPIQAQTAPTTADDSRWSFVDVIRRGQDGFTQLDSGRAGPNGMAVVSGVRNGRTGLFRVDNGVVTEIAVEGTVLPEGLGTLSDIGAFSFQYAILPDGDVLFKARATDGTLSPAFLYTFRWSNSTITVAKPSEEVDPETLTQAFDHELTQVTTDDRWLATLRSGVFPDTTTDYGLTDGTVRRSIFSFTRSSANCIGNTVLLAAANAGGVVAHYRVLQERALIGGVCQGATTRTWSVSLAGGATGQIAGGVSTEDGNTYTGAELSDTDLFLMNNQNQVAAVRKLFNSPTTFIPRRQLVVFRGNGSEEVIQDTDGPVSGIFLADFDQQGRVLYSVSLDADPVATVLLGGPSLAEDRVLGTGDTLFGHAVTALSWVARPGAVADDERTFAFHYRLADGAVGIALARQQRPRWTNPAGGQWGTAANWTPSTLPGAGDDVIFDLLATYAVDLGAQQVGGVSVENGAVTLRNGTLDLPGADGQLGISARNADSVARLTIAGLDTEVTAPAVAVGAGGAGELHIEGATVNYPDTVEAPAGAILGFAAPATATVTAGGFWLWPEMALGLTHDAGLRVEDGAVSGFGAERFFVGGSILELPLRSQTGRVVVDNSSDAGGRLGTGTLLGPIEELVVGESLIGRLDVTNGGHALAITTTVGTRDHGATTDGFLAVDGTTPTRTAHFTSGDAGKGGLFLATGNGTDAQVVVSAGGTMSLTQLSLADGAQSNALMFVDGMEAADAGERRSTVIAPLPPSAQDGERSSAQNPQGGDCVIGRTGQGTLNVSNGALLRCRQLAVGFGPDSRGDVNINGSFRVVPAEVVADGPRAEDGAICVGRVPFCGAISGNVRGQVVLGTDGILRGRIVAIGAGGRLRGAGTVIAREGVVAFDGGSIAPGIAQMGGMQRIGAAQQAGTLTIQGNVTVSATGVITLHVLGGAPQMQDRLVVSGTANLGGQLALNFGNGYAPQQGDQFALIQANTVNGAPQRVVITGLEPGFEFDLAAAGGVLTLTALNDGVATTPASDATVFLPLVTRAD